VGQQVSVASAAAIWRKLEEAMGMGVPADRILAADFDALRACGLSRQKQGYARSLAELTVSGGLDFANLPDDDEAAIELLTRIKGIGRWSAEIYLLFAEGRADVFPAGDLAVQIELGRLLGLPERPSEKQLRTLTEGWRPWRGAAAIFAWHHYNTPVF
jgi:DNA-3-methyladenine glycosylase II